MPADAAMATSGARSRTPADSSNAPWRVSVPRRCTFCQGSARAPGASEA